MGSQAQEAGQRGCVCVVVAAPCAMCYAGQPRTSSPWNMRRQPLSSTSPARGQCSC